MPSTSTAANSMPRAVESRPGQSTPSRPVSPTTIRPDSQPAWSGAGLASSTDGGRTSSTIRSSPQTGAIARTAISKG
ncbi:hypothetical protein ACVCAH_22155 [Micromonospora sp. LZ34]